jgi:protein involved in polysaccharide export with SLBB domain
MLSAFACWAKTTLKREKIRLSDAGTISFPIIGEIRVLGKRVVELEDTDRRRVCEASTCSIPWCR